MIFLFVTFPTFGYAFSGQRCCGCFVLIARRSMQQLIPVKSAITESFLEEAPQQGAWRGMGGGVSNFNHSFCVLIFVVLPTLQLLASLVLSPLLLLHPLPPPLVATCTSNLRARLIVASLRANCGQPQVRSLQLQPPLHIHSFIPLSPPVLGIFI